MSKKAADRHPFLWLGAIVLLLLTLFPFVWVVRTSVTPHDQIFWPEPPNFTASSPVMKPRTRP